MNTSSPPHKNPHSHFDDGVMDSWIEKCPHWFQPYLRLSRYDRPVGFWLLAQPCWMGLALVRIDNGLGLIDIFYMLLFGVGAVAMRGAGCTYNDILDRDIDARVTRTSRRPLPLGQISLKQAWLWLGLQCLVGCLILLCLPPLAQWVALASIPLVAAYPLMKRITWWPQAWLGLTFNWGLWVAMACAGMVGFPALLFYLGLMCWTIGYDTIYALQDKEDDALIGVKSTARLFGVYSLYWVGAFYALMTLLIGMAVFFQGGQWLPIMCMIFIFVHAVWQILTLARFGDAKALSLFKSNVQLGGGLVILLILAGYIPHFV